MVTATKKNKYEGLPKVTYTVPKQRAVLRRLKQRELGDNTDTDRVILQQSSLNPDVPMQDYLKVWSVSTGTDLTHLTKKAKEPASEILS